MFDYYFSDELKVSRKLLSKNSLFPISKGFPASKRLRGRVRKRRKVRKIVKKKDIARENAVGKKKVSLESETQKIIQNKLPTNNVNDTSQTVGSKLNNQVNLP